MTKERFEIKPDFELEEWPVIGDVPGGIVPGMAMHKGIEPATPEELDQLNRDLNNGHHIDTARRHGGIMKILYRDGAGWRILVGTAVAMGTGAVDYELTRELLKNKKRHK